MDKLEAIRKTRMHMWIKKPIFKIFAPILALSLIMVGGVPVSTACEGVCECCSSVSGIDNSIVPQPDEIIWEQPYVSLTGLSLYGHQSHISVDIYSQDQNCHQGIETASCDMEPISSPEFIQGPGPNVSRAEDYIFSVYVIINSDLLNNIEDVA